MPLHMPPVLAKEALANVGKTEADGLSYDTNASQHLLVPGRVCLVKDEGKSSPDTEW